MRTQFLKRGGFVRADGQGHRISVVGLHFPDMIVQIGADIEVGSRVAIALQSLKGDWMIAGARVLSGTDREDRVALVLLSPLSAPS